MMIKDKLDHLVTVTKRAGIPATLDPPKITPPGAWVCGRRLDTETLPGFFTTVADVYLITRDTGIIPALETLDGMLEAIGIDSSTATIIVTIETSTELPAAVIRFCRSSAAM